MNYYEHHIRDYDAATSHLTWDEDLAYTRLIRWYYRKEMPIPADIGEACRQVRATSRSQKQAVEAVLREFFTLGEDGWHQQTCDDVIAAFRAGEPEREARKANEENRLKRHREERAALFKRLTDVGQHAPWNIGMNELRALVKRLEATPATQPETLQQPLPATAPATPATATQTPIPSTQYPEGVQHTSTTSTEVAREDTGRARAPATPLGMVGFAMRKAGLQTLNLDHPKLKALMDQGVTAAEFESAARDSVAKGKGFAYALAVVEGRRRDAQIAPLPDKPPGATIGKQQGREVAARSIFGGEHGGQHERGGDERDITGEAERVA